MPEVAFVGAENDICQTRFPRVDIFSNSHSLVSFCVNKI